MYSQKLFLFAIFSATLPFASSQSTINDPGAKRMCDSVSGLEVPAADKPDSEEKTSLANCSSEDLYFGFGQAADPVKARKCAYVEMEQRKDDLDIAGRAILAMVYANGNGADRNLDLALKFACEMPGEGGDVAGNIYELDRMRRAPANARFNVCDHSAGAHLYKSCAILSDRFDQVKRGQQISSITGSWSARDKRAFASLQQAAENFFKSRAGSEINLEPTFEVQEKAFMENGFITRLEQLQKGELPKYSAADWRKAESDMNSEYAETQKDPNRRWGTATVQGVKNTQQLWLKYREEWVRFGRTKYPQVSADSWKAWITQERVAMLNSLLH